MGAYSRHFCRGRCRSRGCGRVLFCDSHTQLELDAAWRFASEVVRWNNAEHDPKDAGLPALLYGDSDVMRDGHYCQPSFRTFPNLGKLQAHDYLGDVSAIRKDLPSLVGWPSKDGQGYLPYDIALRVMERNMPVAHVRRAISHVIGDDYPNTHEKCRIALEGHLARVGIQGRVEDGPVPRTFRIRYELPSKPALVSVVIPSKDNPELLRACISSVLNLTTYPNFEMVVVENNSVQPNTFQLYDELKQDSHVRVVTRRPDSDGPKFN